MSTRYSRYSKWMWTIGLMGISTAALADEPKPRPPQEPAGFVVGGVIGAFAAGPIGAVVGAGLGDLARQSSASSERRQKS